jgi:hypothetical protein
VLSMHLQHEPPEVPEESTSEEEEEEKSLATHIAMRPSVVREAVSTKSTRTGKLDAGDFLQVHEEQMGQKGIVRLRITVVPEVMPEEECVVIAYTYIPIRIRTDNTGCHKQMLRDLGCLCLPPPPALTRDSHIALCWCAPTPVNVGMMHLGTSSTRFRMQSQAG